jgi:hypothetical protein
MEDGSDVKFSNQFSYDPYILSFTLSSVGVGVSAFKSGDDSLAPHFNSSAFSEFFDNGQIATQFFTDKDILLHKNLAIIKRSIFVEDPVNFDPNIYKNYSDKTKVGDILNLSSDIVDVNLLVNKVIYFTSDNKNLSGTFTQSKPTLNTTTERYDTYIYAYSNFNENIINNLNRKFYLTKKKLFIHPSRWKISSNIWRH